MLSYRSYTTSRINALVFIPAMVVFVVLSSESSFSQKFERNGNKVVYRGNTFEYDGQTLTDTVIVTDPVTGSELTKVIRRDPTISKMNGIPVYGTYLHPEEIEQAEPYASDGSVENRILKGISTEVSSLPDGKYIIDLSMLIADKTGKVVYYQYNGIRRVQEFVASSKTLSDGNSFERIEKSNAEVNNQDAAKKAIARKIDQVINTLPKLKPAKLKGKNVAAAVYTFTGGFHYELSVKDHKATIKYM